MDRILDNEIQNLLDAQIGDSGRLEFIRQSLQEDKPLYNSDRKYIINLISKYSSNDSILYRLNYIASKTIESETIIEKPTPKKRTKTKILIIIGITIFAYAGIRLGLVQMCAAQLIDCTDLREILSAITLHIPSGHIGGGVIEWSGSAKPEFKIDYAWYLQQNLYFAISFVVIPLLAIIGVILKDKRT